MTTHHLRMQEVQIARYRFLEKEVNRISVQFEGIRNARAIIRFGHQLHVIRMAFCSLDYLTSMIPNEGTFWDV
jgi:hypothetical protein